MLAQHSFASTAAWFASGGLVTVVFSGSLAALTDQVQLAEVLAIGMLVPCFTWVVQLLASAGLMPSTKRTIYWSQLGRACFVGSVALLPAAVVNYATTDVFAVEFVTTATARWLSVANVLASVVLMALFLFRRAAVRHIALAWPISFCATISVNMALFLASSWHWW